MTAGFLFRRLLQSVPTVFGIILVTFVLVHLAPGDPIYSLVGEGADARQVAAMRREYGLDRPLPAQFATYLGNVARGDLGDSFAFGEPVSTAIRRRIWPTALLMGTALIFASSAGIVLGTLAARRPSGRLDFSVNLGTLLFHAVPGFWLGQLTLLFFAVKLGLFPVGGYVDIRTGYTGMAHIRDVLYHLILPATVLAVSEITLLARVTRTNLIEQTGRDYMRTARAKGLGRWEALSRHAVPNALLPVVTIFGSRLGQAFSGALIIENIFGWPGLGTLTRRAVEVNDHPLVLGMVLFVAVCVVVANLVTDLVYAWVDPRIRTR